MKAKCIIARSSFLYGIVAGTITLTFSAITYGQPLIYDNSISSSSAQLEKASSALPNSKQSLGISDEDQGLIYRNFGSSVTSGADLVIDYSSGTPPQFVIGGFNDQGDGTEVKTNRVTITKGDVQGPVYGGLSFVSKIFADVDKSSYPVIPDNSADEQSTSYNNKQTVNHNQVEVKGHVTISNGDVHGGNVRYWNQIANVTAGTVQLDSSISQYVAASATAEAFAVSTGNASADENKVLVRQGGKVDKGIYGGRVTIRACDR